MRSGLPGIYPRLWRYCITLTGNRDLADDLAQATCTRALEKAALFDPDTHLVRWTFRMAQRIWLNDLRASRVRSISDQVDPDETPSHSPDAEMNIFASQVLSRVMGLPEGQRMAVLLVYVEGYRYTDAAEILEVPIGTIMSRLATARRKLADMGAVETPGGDE